MITQQEFSVLVWLKFMTKILYFVHSLLALEISAELPSEEELERWYGEPVKAAILPTSLFLTNKKGTKN